MVLCDRLPGTEQVWTPALLGRAGLWAPAQYHGDFYCLCLPRALAGTSLFTGRAAGQHVRGRGGHLSPSASTHIYSLFVIPDPASEMRLSCGRGSSWRVLREAHDPAGRKSQQGRCGAGHGLLVHIWNLGAHWALLVMHRASVRYWEAPGSSLRVLAPCLSFPISKMGIALPPCPGCCKGLNELLFAFPGLVRTFSKGGEVF